MHSRSTLTNTTRTKRLFVHARTKREKKKLLSKCFSDVPAAAAAKQKVLNKSSLCFCRSHMNWTHMLLSKKKLFFQKKKLFVSSTAALCYCQPITLELRICSTAISSNYLSFILLFYNLTKVYVENKYWNLNWNARWKWHVWVTQ